MENQVNVADSTLSRLFQACLPGASQKPAVLWPAFWQHDPASECSPQAWIDSTLRFQEETGTALVKLTGPAHYQVVDRGVEGSWQGAPLGERTFTRRAVHELGDWEKIPADFTAAEQMVVQVAAEVRRRLPVEVPLLATVFSPATQALMLAEPACFAAQVKSAPEVIRAALARIAGQTAGLIARFAEAGVNGIFLVSKHHSPSLIAEPDYVTVIHQSDRLAMEACRVFAANILHLHGEPVHALGWPEQDDWMLHIEPGSRNPARPHIRAKTSRPVLLALDYPAWERGDVATPIRSGLAELGQHAAIVGSPCAVPLRYARSEIAAWVRRIRELS